MLRDRSIFKRKKLGKMPNSKIHMRLLSNFQTMFLRFFFEFEDFLRKFGLNWDTNFKAKLLNLEMELTGK